MGVLSRAWIEEIDKFYLQWTQEPSSVKDRELYFSIED